MTMKARFATVMAMLVAAVGLSGCALLVDALALEEVGLGEAVAGARFLSGGALVEADAVMAEALVSDELSVAANGMRITPAMEGELGQALGQWTAGGTKIGKLAVGADGTLGANGYVVGHISREGFVYAASGSRIGYFSALDGRLYEILADKSVRSIGSLRGFTADSGVSVSSNISGGTVVRVLKPDSIVDIIGIQDGHYLVRLVNGQTGWVSQAGVTELALLGGAQVGQNCPIEDDDGIAVRASGERVPFDRCLNIDGGLKLATRRGSIILPKSQLAFVLSGDGVTERPSGTPRYMLSYNGSELIRVPKDSSFDRVPIDGLERIPSGPFVHRGQ